MKNRLLLLVMVGAIGLFTACGSADEEATSGEELQEETSTEETAEVFGSKCLEEYPISDDVQAKLDALETDYSKVNWDVEYMPADGIVVSEAAFQKQYNFGSIRNELAVAFTNTTDSTLALSYEGYAENISDEVIGDFIDNEIILAPGNTVLKFVTFKDDIPSGNINWKKIETTPSEKVIKPYELSTTLENENGVYSVNVEIITDDWSLEHDDYSALVLDKDGNILSGGTNITGAPSITLNEDTFGGANEAVAGFVNPYWNK